MIDILFFVLLFIAVLAVVLAPFAWVEDKHDEYLNRDWRQIRNISDFFRNPDKHPWFAVLFTLLLIVVSGFTFLCLLSFLGEINARSY